MIQVQKSARTQCAFYSDSSRIDIFVTTEENVDIRQNNKAQLQKSSYKRNKEFEKKEKNLQKISKAFKKQKEKRRNADKVNPSYSFPIHNNQSCIISSRP